MKPIFKKTSVSFSRKKRRRAQGSNPTRLGRFVDFILDGLFYGSMGLSLGIFLVGCTGSTYSSHFDCPIGQGQKCASISKVNHLLDTRQLDLGEDPLESQGGTQESLRRTYVYYGPDRLTRLITIDPLALPAREP